MKTVINGLSNERLEDQIAKIYQEAHYEAPSVRVQETGLLAELWAEFDDRHAAGRIARDTDWRPRDDWE